MTTKSKHVGPTPAGGDLAHAVYRDAEGKITHDSKTAATVEIREMTRDGDELARTYMSRGTSAPTTAWRDPGTTPDEPLVTFDVKGTWDVWDNVDGVFTLATTADQLIHALGLTGVDLAEQRATISNLMVLSAWGAAPAGLVADVESWLERTRPATD